MGAEIAGAVSGCLDDWTAPSPVKPVSLPTGPRSGRTSLTLVEGLTACGEGRFAKSRRAGDTSNAFACENLGLGGGGCAGGLAWAARTVIMRRRMKASLDAIRTNPFVGACNAMGSLLYMELKKLTQTSRSGSVAVPAWVRRVT